MQDPGQLLETIVKNNGIMKAKLKSHALHSIEIMQRPVDLHPVDGLQIVWRSIAQSIHQITLELLFKMLSRERKETQLKILQCNVTTTTLMMKMLMMMMMTMLMEKSLLLMLRIAPADDVGKVTKPLVVLTPEESVDMWHAYSLIPEDDNVRSATIRKVQKETATGTSSRVRTTLAISVESIDFDTQACVGDSKIVISLKINM
uniref:eRF1/Pelota-like N-terminal domain-containing protein n=1 Tax=Glossina pallidipes TaxID=7398 RepID=A0A1A9Z5M2_GLOPL